MELKELKEAFKNVINNAPHELILAEIKSDLVYDAAREYIGDDERPTCVILDYDEYDQDIYIKHMNNYTDNVINAYNAQKKVIALELNQLLEVFDIFTDEELESILNCSLERMCSYGDLIAFTNKLQQDLKEDYNYFIEILRSVNRMY